MTQGQPTIEVWNEEDEDGGTVTAGITWPNSHYSEYSVGYEWTPDEVGFSLGSIFRAAKKVVKKGLGVAKVVMPLSFNPEITKAVAPATANLIAPGSGAAMSKLVNKGFDTVKMIDKATDKKKRGKAAASAKLIADVGDVLKQPATMAALGRVGVSKKQAAKAAAMFDGIKHATAAIAYKQQGNMSKALEHGRRAEALAKAAGSSSSPDAAARKLYYLALAPGG